MKGKRKKPVALLQGAYKQQQKFAQNLSQSASAALHYFYVLQHSCKDALRFQIPVYYAMGL